MYIVFDGRYITEEPTGIGNYSKFLLSSLLQSGSGHSYIVLQESGPVFEGAAETVQATVSHQSHPFQEIWLYRTLNRMKKRFDRFLFHSPAFHLPYGITGFTRMATIHDMTAFLYPETVPSRFGSYMRFSVRRSAKNAHCIVVSSESVKEDLAMHVPAAKGKTEVVRCGLHPFFCNNDMDTNSRVFQDRRGLPAEYLLVLGTLEPRKNISNILRAVTPLYQKYQIPLIFAGKTGWRSEVFMADLQTALQNNVARTLGYVDENNLYSLVKNALLTIFTPLYEGFGLPLIESMACGVPVVASDIPALREIGADIPFFCDPNDPYNIRDTIAEVVESRDQLDARLQKGITHARSFTWESTAKQVVGLYELE